MELLNLYAGIGGNRKLWPDTINITAVEHDKRIADVYKEFYPGDEVIVTDAHSYLLENFKKYDFIWGSPPCPSHGQFRYRIGVIAKGYKPLYPDMKLYEEIILLKYHFQGVWVIENTIPYYEPLIEAQKVGRHLFWANFDIPEIELAKAKIRSRNKISELEEYLGISLKGKKVGDKRQVLRNCTDPILGLHILQRGLNGL